MNRMLGHKPAGQAWLVGWLVGWFIELHLERFEL